MSLKFIEISRNLSHPAKMKLCAQKAEKPFWSYLALPTLNGPYQALLDINICAASRLFFWSLKTVEFKNTFWHKIFSYDPGSVMATPNVQWPNYILSYIIRPVGGTTWLCNSCTVPYRDIDLIWLFATLVRLCKNIVCPDYFIVALVILWIFAAKMPVRRRLPQILWMSKFIDVKLENSTLQQQMPSYIPSIAKVGSVTAGCNFENQFRNNGWGWGNLGHHHWQIIIK